MFGICVQHRPGSNLAWTRPFHSVSRLALVARCSHGSPEPQACRPPSPKRSDKVERQSHGRLVSDYHLMRRCSGRAAVMVVIPPIVEAFYRRIWNAGDLHAAAELLA